MVEETRRRPALIDTEQLTTLLSFFEIQSLGRTPVCDLTPRESPMGGFDYILSIYSRGSVHQPPLNLQRV